MFDINTEVKEVTDINFSRIPYTLYKLEDLFVFREDSSYLIDVIGFLISVQEYPRIQHGYADRMKLVVIQLYANGFYVLFYLYGEFFNRMTSALMNSPNQAPIVLLESFKVRVSRDIDDDFVNFSNAANILHLMEKDEDGIYNIVGTIKSIHNHYDWWYYCCPSEAILELLNNGFRCSACERDIKNAIKMFKVTVDVEDYSGHSIFILYDRAATLLLKRKLHDVIQLFEANYLVVYVPSYPPCFDDIIGKEVVLKVDRKRVGYTPYIGTFKVINCCDDVGVISKFKIEEVSNVSF
ncbi:uncharacterized protein LOC110266890 [Arachis ipaensis]|uniref:uncharacterized protein LOC110266890 n=1 Tax=Arachis ipaensis TaxID=130454 RepID=UPI000A2B1A12|nr:uncharacterized protein LOC110266890 [Arachis ipaensis]